RARRSNAEASARSVDANRRPRRPARRTPGPPAGRDAGDPPCASRCDMVRGDEGTKVGWVQRSADPTAPVAYGCVGTSLTLDPTYLLELRWQAECRILKA